jgi:hypothetical protein
MRRLTRRSALMLPLLAAPAVHAATWRGIPPFPDWIGRTALLRGDGGAARLLLGEDGTGLMSVRLLFFCHSLPILSWRLGPDGRSVGYRRVSALDANRVVAGEGRILEEERQILWIESQRRTADFEGFGGPELARRCG